MMMNNGVSDIGDTSLTNIEQHKQMSLSGVNSYCIRAVLGKRSAVIHECSEVDLF